MVDVAQWLSTCEKIRSGKREANLTRRNLENSDVGSVLQTMMKIYNFNSVKRTEHGTHGPCETETISVAAKMGGPKFRSFFPFFFPFFLNLLIRKSLRFKERKNGNYYVIR